MKVTNNYLFFSIFLFNQLLLFFSLALIINQRSQFTFLSLFFFFFCMELSGNFNEDFPVLSTIFMNNKNPKPSLFPQNHTSSHLLIHPNLCNVEGSSSNPFLTMSPQNISSFNSFSAQSNTGFPLPNQNLSHDAYGYSQNSSPYTLPMDMPPTMDFHAHIGPLSAAVEQEPVIPTDALTERTVETKPRRDRSRMKETRSAGNSTSTREQWSAQEDR